MKIIALLPESSRMEEYGLLPTLSYPDSSMVKNGNPVYIPDFDDSFSGHFYLAVKFPVSGKMWPNALRRVTILKWLP